MGRWMSKASDMRVYLLICLAVVGSNGFPNGEYGQDEKAKDVVDVAVSSPGFKTLVKLVTDLGLVDTLKKAKEVTVFAPTDEAFDKLSKEKAKKIVLTHVVSGKFPAAAVKEGKGDVETLSGEKITLVKSGHDIKVEFNLCV